MVKDEILRSTFKSKALNKLKTNKKSKASLVAQMVKNLPVMQETWVQSLSWEVP